mgnify:CR=1 FL=1
MQLKILYEDNHLLIVDKPHGLVTQPSQEHQDSLEQRAKDYIKKTYHKPGLVYLHAVHRLDKDVAGIVIFAKTSKALERMHACLRNRQVKKTYRAKVRGLSGKNRPQSVSYKAWRRKRINAFLSGDL